MRRARQKREDPYANIIECARQAIIVFQDGKVVCGNPAASELTGRPRNELRGFSYFDIVHPNDRAMILSRNARRLKGQSPPPVYEYRIKTKDGHVRWVQTSASRIEWNGKPATLAFLTDITERRRTESVLDERDPSRAADTVNGDFAYVFDVGEGNELRATWVSDGFERITGISATDPDKHREWKALIHPEDMSIATSHLSEIRRGEPDTVEYRIITSSGDTRWVRDSACPIRDTSTGHLIEVHGAVHDITAAKRVQDLAATQRDLGLALSCPMGLVDALRLCLKAAVECSGMDSGGVYLVDDTGALALACSVGLSDKFIREVSHYAPDSPNTRLVRAGKAIYSTHEQVRAEMGRGPETEGLRSLSIVPIRHEGAVIACLNASSHTCDEVPTYGRQALEIIASQIGTAIAGKKIERAMRETARFPNENPNPVLRVSEEGRVLYANEASAPLLESWDLRIGMTVPEEWRTAVRCCLRCGKRRLAEIAQGDTVFSLMLVPVTNERYLNIYARDITDRKEAERVQSVLFQISQAMVMSSDLRSLLAIIHGQLGSLIDTTNFFIALYDTEARTYTFPYHVDRYDEAEELATDTLEGSLTDYVRRTGKPLLVDQETHERLMRAGEASLIGTPSPSWLGVPLRSGDRVFGVVVVQSYDESKLYTERDLALMTFVSENISVAIERKRTEESRRELEAQVQHAQKLESLGILAGGIAHDFNNLLTGVLGNADLAAMNIEPGSAGADNIKEIRVAAERAAELCQQMLAYSGRGTFMIEPIALNSVVTEMGHLLEASISKKATITYRLASTSPTIVADATQARQVIMNLITNASDALGDSEGVITVSTGIKRCDRAYLADGYVNDDLKEGNYAYIEVADTGCGMDEETRLKLFDPFYSTKFTGRGLGLAAVLGIVRGHRGAIIVESAPGNGTTIRILFPAHNISPRAKTHAKPQRKNNWAPSGKVLLVDDEQAVRAVGTQMLQAAGLSVLTASGGNEAVVLFRQHESEIGCVLLDLTMPDMDGEETFRELTKIRADVPVILSSGYSEQEVSNRFGDGGPAGFIQKPYLLATLRDKVRAVMEENSPPGEARPH